MTFKVDTFIFMSVKFKSVFILGLCPTSESMNFADAFLNILTLELLLRAQCR